MYGTQNLSHVTQDVLHWAPQNPLKSSVDRSLKIIHSTLILELRKQDVREVKWLGSNDSTSTQASLWEDYLTKTGRVEWGAKQPFTPSPSLNCQGTSWVEPEPTGPGLEIQPEWGRSHELGETQLRSYGTGFAHPTIIYWPPNMHAVIWWTSLGSLISHAGIPESQIPSVSVHVLRYGT